MIRSFAVACLGALPMLVLAGPLVAHEASPLPSEPARTWPSGDSLRRELQGIGFAFRVDRASGDWLGWAPRASVVESAALTLGGSGSSAASARFDFSLLETDLLGADIDAALTAFMEVASRLPLDADEAERTRRFVVTDLLTQPPVSLEPCYAQVDGGGAILVSVDAEAGSATLQLAADSDALSLDEDFELSACAPIAASIDGPAPGEPTSERLTIGTTNGATPAFDPAEPVLEGALVTVVLTFRNDTSSVQSLTFEAPLEADTGPVEPGEVRLIVVRQLKPGSYTFYSSGDASPRDASGMRGVLHIQARADR